MSVTSARLIRSLLRIFACVTIISIIGFAVLAIALRQPTFTTIRHAGAIRAEAADLQRHVTFLTTQVLPRSAAHPDNLERAAAYIESKFTASGACASRQRFHARGHEYSNVIAEFGPDDPRSPLLIIGAHYDAFADTGMLPGADDNASGTAGLIELAHMLGATSDLKQPVMLVAFTNEEPPFFGSDQMGSAVHAQSLISNGRTVRGMINLEMIGYFSEEQSWPNALFALIYPKRGDFIGVTGGWQDRHLTKHVKRAIAGGNHIRVVSFTGPHETSDASDHRNYWRHGWPAVMVTDTAFLRNPHYHTTRDTAGTLDYVRMARVIDGVYVAARSY